MQENPYELLSVLNSIPGSQPIRSRISDMWPYWKDGLRYMQSKGNIGNRNKKKVISFYQLYAMKTIFSAPLIL